MHSFSKTSDERLSTCDEYIQKVLRIAIKRSIVDFGVAQGERTIELQRQYFKEGKSKIDPDQYHPETLPLKAKHIVDEVYTKSGAVDVFVFISGKGASWDVRHLCYIAGVIMSVDAELEGLLRWGGNWDMDGEIISDQTFQDLPHFEIYNRRKG